MIQPWYHEGQVTLYHGDVRETLRELPEGSVHCVVTSPPYYGLRDYKIPPVIWGGRPDCVHSWVTLTRTAQRSGGPGKQDTNKGGHHPKGLSVETATCRRCKAQRCVLGLEPTVQYYVAHLVDVFREVRRVLRKDGVVFLNLGDSFAGSGGAHKAWHNNPGISKSSNRDGVPRPHTGDTLNLEGRTRYPHGPNKPPSGMKPKDIMLIPPRVAIALQNDGWWVRAPVVWHKPNILPESPRDRPTIDYEMVYVLTQSRRNFWDQEAAREPVTGNAHPRGAGVNPKAQQAGSGNRANVSFSAAVTDMVVTRNIRAVWSIPNQSYKGKHYATFPRELVRRCIAAGTSEHGCCAQCGKQYRREVDIIRDIKRARKPTEKQDADAQKVTGARWSPTCKHDAAVVPSRVLDIFMGSGTTAAVGMAMNREVWGIEISKKYLALERERIMAPISNPDELPEAEDAGQPLIAQLGLPLWERA